MFRRAFLMLSLAVWALPVRAEVAPETAALFEAIGMREIIGIMRDEGIDYAGTIEDDLFPGRGGSTWDALVSDIYDADAMETVVLERFDTALGGADLEPLLGFFESERGRRIIDLEVSARRALMDETVEADAVAAVAEMKAEDPARFELLGDFIEVNDLVESNVMGAMNSNYAFYIGLMEGNAFGRDLTETDILNDVWAQEDDIRAETEEWVFSYLGLAYGPLAAADIEAYIALSETDSGRALNRALFEAFDKMYVEISRNLGFGAAGFMVGEDI